MRRCKVQDFYRKVIVFDVLINVFDVLINIHEGVKNIYEALVNRKLSVLSFISCDVSQECVRISMFCISREFLAFHFFP